jgi:hypothetical protein
MLLSSIAPIALFLHSGRRGERWALGWGAFLMVAGFVLHRADVGGISHIAITGRIYVPAPTEVAVSLGIVSALGLVFLFFVEHLKVWEEPPAAVDHFTPAVVDPVSSQFIGSPWLGGGQRAALATICGIVVGIGLVEVQVAARGQTEPRPVHPPRSVAAKATARPEGRGLAFAVVSPAVPATPSEVVSGDGTLLEDALLIDGGGEGRFVLFPHAAHRRRLGGEASCARCHHRNVPLDRATSCSHCHRDMYRWTDTFDHARHVEAHGQRRSCSVCHPDRRAARSRSGSRPCASCHLPTPPHVTRVVATGDGEPGLAPGYERAMHGLCLECHREQEKALPARDRYLSRCATCHRGGLAERGETSWRPPFVTVASRAAGSGRRSAASPRLPGEPPAEGSP